MYRYENEQLFKITFAIFGVEALTDLDPNKHKLLYAEQKYQDSQLEANLSQQQPQRKNNETASLNRQFYYSVRVYSLCWLLQK